MLYMKMCPGSKNRIKTNLFITPHTPILLFAAYQYKQNNIRLPLHLIFTSFKIKLKFINYATCILVILFSFIPFL